MKFLIPILTVSLLSSCNPGSISQSSLNPEPGNICSGVTILGVIGTANCSGQATVSTDPLSLRINTSRTDNYSFPSSPGELAAFFASPERQVATLDDEQKRNDTYTNGHSIIPSPLDDSDGVFAFGTIPASGEFSERTLPAKRHYLETIAIYDSSITARGDIVTCGNSGTVASRILDCQSKNGLWAYYDGKKYGQEGEGDWRQVTVYDDGGTKFEVWRDERTKLLWSDNTLATYNWFQAAGYSKLSATSLAETTFDTSPGGTYQPANPVSVCPDIIDDEIAAGGGTSGYLYSNPEVGFKGGLSYPQVIWRLPTISDFRQADVNGIKKVLPNMSFGYWSATSTTYNLSWAWYYLGGDGFINDGIRTALRNVRCVASSID